MVNPGQEARIRKKYRQACASVNRASVDYTTAGDPVTRCAAQEWLNAALAQQHALESQFPWLVSSGNM